MDTDRLQSPNPSGDVTGDLKATQTLASLQHEIERQFGNCMLRLQNLDNVVKALLAQHDITIVQTHPGAPRMTVLSAEGLTTFGMAVNTLFAILLVPDTAASHDPPRDAAALRMGLAALRMGLDDDAA